MWFWPINVKAWWIVEDCLYSLARKVRRLRETAQLDELARLKASLAELVEV